MVFLGFRLSRRPATERYPYGLERAEDLAGIGIAVVIWASAAFAGYESIRKLIGHGPTSHVGAGIAGAAIGIAGNQAAPVQTCRRQADQLGTPSSSQANKHGGNRQPLRVTWLVVADTKIC